MNEFIKYMTSKTPLTEKLAWDDLETENALRHTNKQFRKMVQNQLESTNVSEKSAPSILHLTVLIYFLTIHQSPLNVSGKYVPHIIKHLSPLLLDIKNTNIPTTDKMIDQHQLLINAQEMILSGRKTTDTSSSSSSPLPIDLELMKKIRDLGLNLCK